jgi:hypothetical protein
MKYLVMMQIDPAVLNSLSPGDWEFVSDGHKKLLEETKASGEFILTEALADPSQSAVVRKLGDTTAVKDGPFTESKEFVGGFYLFDVESRERAIELASRIPDASIEGLAVEVRPVMTPSAGDL